MTDSHHGPLTIGRVIAARYEVLRLLHNGPRGTVYEARAVDPTRAGQRLSLRVLPDELCREPLPGRLQREARMLAQLDDAHVGGATDLFEEDGLGIFVAELFEDPCLAEVLRRRGALPVEQAVDVAIQLCAALEAAHEVGVVHRALGADDVLLEGWSLPPEGAEIGEPTTPHVRLTGFVLGSLLRGLPRSSEAEDGACIDTEAPEQARGEEAEPRSDLYAVGALLSGMLLGPSTPGSAGQPPNARERLASLRQLGRERGIPDALVRVVAKAMSPSLQDRHSSAIELRGELQGALPCAEPPERGEPEVGAEREVTAASIAESGVDDPVLAAAPMPESDADDSAVAADGAIGTTMKSNRDSALEVGPRGAKVQLLVGEAAPAGEDERPKPSEPRPSSVTRRVGEDGVRERQLWAVAAVLAAVAAVAVGIWLGVR